ncbi:MAG: hypothetical protein AAF411_05685 [Myxococcota bacterium]
MHRTESGWALVVEKLVRIGADYYRPRRFNVYGEDEILERIESVNPALCDPARRAMSNRHGNYRFAGGRLERVDRDAGQTKREAQKNYERLAARCKSLEMRIDALEATFRQIARRASMMPRPAGHPGSTGSQHGASAGPRPGAQAQPARAASAPQAAPAASASPAAAPAGSASPAAAPAASAPQANPGPSTPAASAASSAQPVAEPGQAEPNADAADTAANGETPADGEAPVEAEAQAGSEADAGGVVAPPTSDPVLQFPSAEEYARGLSSLIGEPVKLEDGEAWPVDEGTYVTELITDDDEVVGAIVADLKAVVRQGGTLMMLGEEVLAEMEDTGIPSEDAVEAMQEIVNVQSRCFNDIPGNPHLRIRGFGTLDPEKDAWMTGSVHRTGYVDEFGGRTQLLSR